MTRVNSIFNPNFRYTHKIVKNLVEIASAREIVLNSYLVPKWEVSLRRTDKGDPCLHSHRREPADA